MLIEQQYIDFFLNSTRDVVGIETIEISHPSISKTYYFVANIQAGETLKLEDGKSQFFEFLPVQFTHEADNNTLDYQLSVQLGDAGTILPEEIEKLLKAEGWRIKPKVTKRDYRSDSLAMIKIIKTECHGVTTKDEGSVMSCGAPRLNNIRRGQIQTTERFPTLEQFR